MTELTQPLDREIIQLIHQSGHKGVIYITGGGIGVFGELLKWGGGSATLLEGQIPYSLEAWDALFGGKRPEKTCSGIAARQLAMNAYQRAMKLSPGPRRFGMGVTASLIKAEGEREGRKNHFHVAIQTAESTTAFSFNIVGGYDRIPVGADRRAKQENLANHVIMWVLARHLCGIKINLPTWANVVPFDEASVTGAIEIQGLVNETMPKYWRPFNASNYGNIMCMFPGSFNPLHEGHLGIAQVIERELGFGVNFEIAVTNADKPPLDYIDIKQRVDQFGGRGILKVVLSNTPLFKDKVALFPNCLFVVGVDTWRRILDPKYGDVELALGHFMRHKARFAVFGRADGDRFVSADSIPLPDHEFFSCPDNLTIIPEDEFRRDVSSSQLRSQSGR